MRAIYIIRARRPKSMPMPMQIFLSTNPLHIKSEDCLSILYAQSRSCEKLKYSCGARERAINLCYKKVIKKCFKNEMRQTT